MSSAHGVVGRVLEWACWFLGLGQPGTTCVALRELEKVASEIVAAKIVADLGVFLSAKRRIP